MRNLLSWLDERTDCRQWLFPVRRRMLPGGPRWEYSTASCLLWLVVVEVVTGFLLMATYSPSTTSAWASVHFIEHTPGGSFIRGLHHYTSHALLILTALHLVRVLLRASFRPPRELIWITGLLALPLVLVWTVTGNPLPATIKGMAQIDVEGHIIASTPLIGPIAQRLLIGGDDVGHLTLTHLYFLHVGLLPLVVGGLLYIHVQQVRRHGLTVQDGGGAEVPYWPDQSVRNMTVLALTLAVIGGLAWYYKAPLDAPADSQLPHTPRPEWYLLFMFELRRYFTGPWEVVATVGIPTLLLSLMLAMPVLDRWCAPRTGHWLRVGIVGCLLCAWTGLTVASLVRDHHDHEYQATLTQGELLAARVRELADDGSIPPEGAAALLRDDPLTQGPLLFTVHCAACHSHLDFRGEGIRAKNPSAPNLNGFATRRWIVDLLDPAKLDGPQYFGQTKLVDGDMTSFLKEHLTDAKTPQQKTALDDKFRKIAWALSAEAGLAAQATADRHDAAEIAEGRKLLVGELGCTDCHRFRGQGDLGSAPDLTDYGSRRWLLRMIANPLDERCYPGELNDRMPAFAADTEHPDANTLSERELGLIVDWLRGEWLAVQHEAVSSTHRP